MGHDGIDMEALRALIDRNCPTVFGSNWSTLNRQGWRWVVNLALDLVGNDEVIRGWQADAGPLNVSLGQPWNDRTMHPMPRMGFCGLYVRDLEDFEADAHRAMDSLEDQVAVWAKEKK